MHFIMANTDRLIVIDSGVAGVFYFDLHIFLRMQINQLFTRLVFKAEFVKTLSLMRITAQYRLRLFSGKG